MPQNNENLKKYTEKRHFNQTPEPQGGSTKNRGLHFVIQKHDASRLHYDFRLEMEGVLKSWAVPKGPSLDPSVKRLAMQVEDHPYDYKDFEGVIPEGNYGAGTVIVWDEGCYEPVDGSAGKGKKAMEQSLLAGLKSGDLKFRLFGEKLQGEFALVKTHGPGMAENAWLLIKHKDEAVDKNDITKKDKSVMSGKTIAQMQKAPGKIYGEKDAGKNKLSVPAKGRVSGKVVRSAAGSGTRSGKENKTVRKPASGNRKKTAGKQSGTDEDAVDWHTVIHALPDAPMPGQIAPMLATLVDAPFDDPDWNFEIKWDGYRAIAFITVVGKLKKNVAVKMKSRNQKPFEEKYYPIKEAFADSEVSMVLDGELVVVDASGLPDFGALQNWRSEADGALFYYVFDMLWYKGKDLRNLPLMVRQAALADVIGRQQGHIRVGYSLQGGGKSFLAGAAKLGLEGMVAKRRESVYETGHRSKDWLKIKVEQRQEVIIIGYTVNKGTSRKFSSLLLGVYRGQELHYAGKVGTGFNDKDQVMLLQAFQPLIRKKSPLATVPDVDKPSRFRPNPPGSAVTWLKPVLVGEVSYRERTADGLFRHPSFKGLRTDKAGREVVLEKERSTQQLLHQNKNAMDENKQRTGRQRKVPKRSARISNSERAAVINEDKNNIKKAIQPPAAAAETLLNPTEKTQVKTVDRHVMQFSHLDKLYWPKEKIPKRSLINYYYQMAPYILPYLKGRPQSLNRFPNGITGQHFYQKDVTGKVPEWISLYLYHSEGDDTDKHFLVADGLAALLYMASLGCIEMNPWSSTVKKPENPTWCIIDLDPDKKKRGRKAFEEVIEAARVTHDVLTHLGIEGYPKTSGASGMHIYIPLGNKYSYEQSKIFAKLIVSMVHEQLSGFTTLERTMADREGKMYLDFLQNRPQATIAAPYSVRPKPGATVSMPLDWSEVKSGLKKEAFNIHNALARVLDTGDVFRPVMGRGVDLKKILKQVE